MNTETMARFFINPAEIINRSQKSAEFNDLAGYVSNSGCQCVNCRSCDNGCNK